MGSVTEFGLLERVNKMEEERPTTFFKLDFQQRVISQIK